MKNHIIITLLFLSVGLSQQIIHTEIYDSENIKSITYHKKTRDKIEIVKFFKYYESGQKKEEGTFKDGKEDGLWTSNHRNGQKRYEGTYKDGKEISGKWWNEDGSVRE